MSIRDLIENVPTKLVESRKIIDDDFDEKKSAFYALAPSFLESQNTEDRNIAVKIVKGGNNLIAGAGLIPNGSATVTVEIGSTLPSDQYCVICTTDGDQNARGWVHSRTTTSFVFGFGGDPGRDVVFSWMVVY